jgi:hypothetical protein
LVASSAEHFFGINQNFKIVFGEQKRNAYHLKLNDLINVTTIVAFKMAPRTP